MEGEPASHKDKVLLTTVPPPRARWRPAAGRRLRGRTDRRLRSRRAATQVAAAVLGGHGRAGRAGYSPVARGRSCGPPTASWPARSRPWPPGSTPGGPCRRSVPTRASRSASAGSVPWCTTRRRWPTSPSSPASAPTPSGPAGCPRSRGPCWSPSPARWRTRGGRGRSRHAAADVVGRGTPSRHAAGPPGRRLRRGLGRARSTSRRPMPRIPLRTIGASAGVGVIVVLGPDDCGVAESARIAHYLAEQSAGQCGPCVYGLPAIADDLARLARGRADPGLLVRLHRRLDQVDGRGACRHPDGVVAPGAQRAGRLRRRGGGPRAGRAGARTGAEPPPLRSRGRRL